jgi:hypothetical protein
LSRMGAGFEAGADRNVGETADRNVCATWFGCIC